MRHRVAQVGVGWRGSVHANAFLELADRFELVGLCDLDRKKLDAYAEQKRLPPSLLFEHADKMLAETRPDVFCFVTQPSVRLPMVELAVKHRVKGLAFEKPMATSLREAWTITRLCRENRIKAVVSHQQKYLTSFQKFKETLDRGDIGEVYRIDATCQASLSQLGTHFVDYVLWANGGRHARWVVGHAHGRELLDDSHPAPNYCMGVFECENGVRSVVEFGRLAPSHMAKDKYWTDNRMTAYGTHGYVWCDTDTRWGAFTRSSGGQPTGGAGDGWSAEERTRLQPLYLRDFANWLDDDAKLSPCNLEISYHGYEIMTALCLSAMDHIRVDLPLDPSRCADIFARMRRELPDCPELTQRV